MLDIAYVEETDKNSIAPTVYIKTVDITDKNIAVNYYLEDEVDPYTGKKYWSDDQTVLDSFKVTISCDGKTSTKALSSIVSKDKTRYEDTVYLEKTAVSSSSVSASCNSQTISGTLTIEPLMVDGKLSKPSGLKYINKARDLRILNPQFMSASYRVNSASVLQDDIYVSYTTNKKAKIGINFDLDAYLSQNSTNYQVLNNYPTFKKLCLQNSHIDTNNSRVYRKDKKGGSVEYIKLDTQIESLKLDDVSGSYLVTFTDHNIDNSYSEFDIKIELSVSDYSEIFFDTHIVQRLSYIKSFIHDYKSELRKAYLDKNIDNASHYFYTYNYDKQYDFIDENGLKSALPLYDIFGKISLEIAQATSIFTKTTVEEYVSLYCSILHPLTAKLVLIDGLLNHIDNLSSLADQFARVDRLESLEAMTAPKTNKLYIKEFRADELSGVISYDYPNNVGYEVINTDTINDRVADGASGLLLVTEAQKSVRKFLETSKYFANPSAATRNNVNTFSVATIDLFNDSYDISQIGQNDLTIYNDILIRLNNLKDKANKSTQVVDYGFQYEFNKYGYILDQFGLDGVCVDTISSRGNSANSLIQNTVFDPNNSTRDISLQFIADTNILGMYLSLDEHKFEKPASQGSIQETAALDATNNQNPKFVITDALMSNIEAKSKLIFYYNQLFTDELLYDGTNYQIYILKPYRENKLFSNIKHFNSYYIVKKKEPENFSKLTYDTVITDEMMQGVPPEYVNRNTTPAKTAISVEDI